LLNKKDDRSILPPVLRKRTIITHEKLAGMTGLTRETVTKQLKKLSQEGLITLDHKYMRLTKQGWETLQSLH
ncbi:MAG: helix-turn-helix domain-containing protein, partial [Candidatus Peribacteraceae bacterium]|nr:helix-turn-helix domain-containing protein [Candidatus Peribacteraceae bacterium]